jgi:hypothetical protein
MNILTDTLGSFGHFENGFGSCENVRKFEFFDSEFCKDRLFDGEVSVLAELDDVLEKEGVLVPCECAFLATNVLGIDCMNLKK